MGILRLPVTLGTRFTGRRVFLEKGRGLKSVLTLLLLINCCCSKSMVLPKSFFSNDSLIFKLLCTLLTFSSIKLDCGWSCGGCSCCCNNLINGFLKFLFSLDCTCLRVDWNWIDVVVGLIIGRDLSVIGIYSVTGSVGSDKTLSSSDDKSRSLKVVESSSMSDNGLLVVVEVVVFVVVVVVVIIFG